MNDFEDMKRVAIARSIAKNVSERNNCFDYWDIFAHLINWYYLPSLSFDEQSTVVAKILKDNPEKYEGLWNERLQNQWDALQYKSTVDLYCNPGANN